MTTYRGADSVSGGVTVATATDIANAVIWASEWAKNGVGVLVSVAAGGNGTTDYSALHWANAASNSASAAAASAASATASETAAGISESNAAASEAAAAISETNAAASETAAGISETNAAASETAAASSETAAGVSETNAAASAAAALVSENNAAATLALAFFTDGSKAMTGHADFGGFNLTNVGTVDGRNVATDGTKLDGIAAGAEVNTVDSVNTQTGAVVLHADHISDATTTNKFTTAAQINKLAGIEDGATADQTKADIDALGIDAASLNGYTQATGYTINSLVLRDSAADVYARLFRTNYATHGTAPGASAGICFRNDATSDNYMRFMTKGAMQTWLGGSGLDADTVDGYHATAYNVFTGNALVTRHSLGYIWSNYFNQSISSATALDPSHIPVCTGSDGYFRWQTKAQFLSNLGIATDNGGMYWWNEDYATAHTNTSWSTLYTFPVYVPIGASLLHYKAQWKGATAGAYLRLTRSGATGGTQSTTSSALHWDDEDDILDVSSVSGAWLNVNL